jgi:hypothetical protein
MPILDDAEPYFGKPGEVIVVGLSGARTYSRIDGPNREAQEPARNVCLLHYIASLPEFLII